MGRQRKKRSRLARWVVRPLVWSPAVLALAVFLLLLLLQSAWFADRARGFAEVGAGRYLGREVEIGELSIDVVPLSIEAHDVVVGPEPATDTVTETGADPIADPTASRTDGDRPPFVEVESVRIDARVVWLVRPGVTLDRVFVDSPVVRISVDEAGRHDAPRPVRRRRREAPRRFEVAIGALEVVNGALQTEFRRYPLEISARNVRANLVGGENLKLAGQVRGDQVSLLLPGARPYLGTVSALGSFERGRIEIAEASFAAPEIRAQASGSWEWRHAKLARFAIDASGEGRLLDQLGYGRELFQGPFDFTGEFSRDQDDWSLAGALSSPGAVVADRELRAVRGRLLVDSDGARYRIENALYGGGTVEGTVRMAIGSASDVELDLRLMGVDVDYLLEDQGIPIAGLSATAAGGFSYQFARDDPQAGNGWADLKIQRRSAGEGLPVDGSAGFTIGRGRLRTDAVRLKSEGQLVLVTGDYDIPKREGRFELEIATQAVDRILELLPAADEDAQAEAIWRPRRGRGSVNATVAIAPSGVRVLTELDLEDVEAPGYSADRAQGSFGIDTVGIRGLRVELLKPSGGLIVTGSVPLSQAAGEEPPLSIAIDAEGWPVADFEPWLPFELPLTGTFAGGISVEGSLEAPRGAARGRVSSPRLRTLTASRLDFDLDYSSESVTFHETELRFGEGSARLHGSYDVPADQLALRLESDRLDLADLELLPVAQGRLTGTVEVSGQIGGSVVRPQFTGDLVLDGVAHDGRVLGASGSGSAHLDWDGSGLQAEGAIEGLLELSGGGALEDGRADLDFAVGSSDLGALLSLVSPRELPPFDSSGSGRLTVNGLLSTSDVPAVRLELDRVAIEQTGSALAGDSILRVENLEPVTIELTDHGVSIESIYLGTPDRASEVFVAGSFELGEARRLDLNIQSSLSASWFDPWVPDTLELAEGRLDFIGSVHGTLSDPTFDGVAEFVEGKVISTGFPATFEDVGSVFLLYPGEIVMDRLTARLAGGRLEGAGTMRSRPDGVFDYRFQFSGDALSFRYPEGWSVRGDADFTLASSPAGRQLSGALRLKSALYVTDVPVELDQLLRSFFEQRRLEAGETDELLSTTQLNLAISADKTLRIRNNLADLRGSADLVLRGSLARPVVFGSVELDSSGKLIYAGNEYEIERGVLTFANPYRLEPVIDLVAHTNLRAYDVTLSLSGTPDRLNFDFISDPPLAELEVMALLTGGARPRDPELDPTRRLAGRDSENVGAESFLYGQATSLVASRFNRLFGLDQFRIDPLTGSTGNLSSARITVGKRLSRDLFATYSYDPAETEQQIFELEWSVSRSLVLVLTQNGDGSYAIDAKWQKAF